MSMARRSVAGLLARSLFTSVVQPAACALQPLAMIAVAAAQPASPFRALTSSAAPMSAALAAALKQEIKHESKEYQKPDTVARGPPAPFKLQEVADDTLLTLTRDFEGETISIDVQVMSQPEADDYTEEGEDGGAMAINSVAFNVAVSRDATQLVFECESDGEEITIMHVSHEPVGKPPGDTHFSGPVFEELDEDLMREFQVYLTARGIDRDLGEYLRHLVHDKEQRLYAAWLQRVHDFVAKQR